MTTITIVCPCGKEVKKRKSEYDRCIKRGQTRFHCDLKCSANYTNRNHTPQGNPKNLLRGRECDEYSSFRWFLRTIQKRKRKSNNLDLEYLKFIWDSQEGVCPITGWSMVLPTSTEGWQDRILPKAASLDRIDNSKGYEKGNVRYICRIANYARNEFDDSILLEFAEAIVSRNKQP